MNEKGINQMNESVGALVFERIESSSAAVNATKEIYLSDQY